MIDLCRRQFLRVSLGLAAGTAGTARSTGDVSLQWRERALVGFGTTVWLRAAHADAARVDAGLDDAVQAIRHVERLMSLFDPASALSRLNLEGRLLDPEPDLLRVLRLAAHVAQRSEGAFDVTMQPLWSVWSRAHREGRMPTHAELQAARACVGWQGLQVEPGRLALARPGMAVSLNGIAQGYAADLARARLQAHGILHALLDTGEWTTLGRAPAGGPWTLALADPRNSATPLAHLAGDGRAIATSSDAHTAFSTDRRHHHIIDPRTGFSPAAWASVTVLAPSAALADALTKVLFMAPAAGALALANRWGVDVILVDRAGRRMTSPGVPWRRHGRAPVPF